MRFRPCIDIHNGKVKQIVGGSLRDAGNQAVENFVSQQDGAFYGNLYKRDSLSGGHIILLNKEGTPYYEADAGQAERALSAYPGGLQVGGGITDKNAARFLDMGASHVIVTSYVFADGQVNYANLEKLCSVTGKERLVLDLSCRRKDGAYYIVTDRWQKFTDVVLSDKVLDQLSAYCDEFLVHAVDVEGKASGIERGLAALLGSWGKIEITYAGGIASYEDIKLIKKEGNNRLDFTVGSALDLFGGSLSYERLAKANSF